VCGCSKPGVLQASGDRSGNTVNSMTAAVCPATAPCCSACAGCRRPVLASQDDVTYAVRQGHGTKPAGVSRCAPIWSKHRATATSPDPSPYPDPDRTLTLTLIRWLTKVGADLQHVQEARVLSLKP